MALIKNFTTDSGITVNYHRIVSISKEGAEIVKVILHSYVDESYRNLEKTNDDLIIKRRKIDEKIDEYVKKLNNEGLTEEEHIEYDNLQKESLVTIPDINKVYFVYDMTVEVNIEEIENLSFKDIYNAIKCVEPFINSEDI